MIYTFKQCKINSNTCTHIPSTKTSIIEPGCTASDDRKLVLSKSCFEATFSVTFKMHIGSVLRPREMLVIVNILNK